MSTPPTAKQAEFLAKALGLDSVWNSFSKASGFIIIADGRTKKYRLKVTRFDTIDTIVAEVQKGLKETP
jgi:hypothetical protein